MVYSRIQVVAPSVEPITLAEAKSHCRIDIDDEDDNFNNIYIPCARESIENLTNRQLITATWDVVLDDFPYGETEFGIPLGKLQSIDSFAYIDVSGASTSWFQNGEDLGTGSPLTVRAHIDFITDPARIVLPYSMIWPPGPLRTSNPIKIRITCGFGSTGASLPAKLRAAMLLLIEHMNANKSAVVLGKSVAVDSKPLFLGVDSLCKSWRIWSFG